jgi:hypothetical protein
MAALSRYTLNSRAPAFRVPLKTLSHELMHRWGIQVRFLETGVQHSSELLGRDGAHWSLRADTAASVMYGGSWQLESGGGVLLVEARECFSRWDLYLAGFAAPEEVPAMRLLRGKGLEPTELALRVNLLSNSCSRLL